jgi:hypothetical protein
MTYKSYISVTSSSSPGFIYLRASHKNKEKKMTCHQNPGPGNDSLEACGPCQEWYFCYRVSSNKWILPRGKFSAWYMSYGYVTQILFFWFYVNTC